MKRKLPLITSIITVLILFSAYFVYTNYFSSFYIANPSQAIQMNLYESTTLELNKTRNQKNIFSVQIDIKCTSPSNLIIELTDSLNNPQHFLRIKKGEIDNIFKFDWYSSQCNLSISCINKKDKLPGLVDIEYRFLGLN